MDEERSTFPRDAPLRLEVAVKAAFPAGGLTTAGLRKEIARGRLEVELIAGKHFTTLAAIERMRELCRVAAKNSPSREAPTQHDIFSARANHGAGSELERLVKATREKGRAMRQEQRARKRTSSAT